ncbi:MAG: hypothetical protein ACPGSN_10205 [Psychrobium sp.]
MTTVAFDGKTLAADSRCINSDGYKDGVKKLAQTDRYAFGIAGSLMDLEVLVDAFLLMEKSLEESNLNTWGSVPMVMEQDVSNSLLLVIEKETLNVHTVFIDDNKVLRRQPEIAPVAIGSGSYVALPAMNLYGRSAKQAVEDAMTMDIGTGGEVKVIELGGSTH